MCDLSQRSVSKTAILLRLQIRFYLFTIYKLIQLNYSTRGM
jgi:hypothetical protein